jgi:hypothetical protein
MPYTVDDLNPAAVLCAPATRSDHRHRSVTAPIRPVQKSPSLTVAESRLPTAVSTATLTVASTICFQRQGGGVHPCPG